MLHTTIAFDKHCAVGKSSKRFPKPKCSLLPLREFRKEGNELEEGARSPFGLKIFFMGPAMGSFLISKNLVKYLFEVYDYNDENTLSFGWSVALSSSEHITT